MAPAGGSLAPSSRDNHRNHGDGSPGTNFNAKPRTTFAAPPLSCRPRLFCCPVAQSNPDHLPRSFVNPGRHLMNLQLRSFLECADDMEYTFAKCEVSHIIEVTTRVLHNNPATSFHGGRPAQEQEQWNVPTSKYQSKPMTTHTPPLETHEMVLDQEESECAEIPYSTYQSMSTRYFITQNTSNTWQVPPHSRQYRETHPEPNQGRAGVEKYMEIPPFKTTPYTSESTPGGSSGGLGARPWIPSCSILIWCSKHGNFYEVHVLS